MRGSATDNHDATAPATTLVGGAFLLVGSIVSDRDDELNKKSGCYISAAINEKYEP